jgi:hypothetical protein
VFVVDDDTGSVDGIAPNQPGYLQAALNRGQVLFSALSNNPQGFDPKQLNRVLGGFNSGARLTFYLVQNSTTDTALSDLAAGRTPPNVFFGTTTNSASTLQVRDLGNNAFSLAWNDQSGRDPQDFNNLVVRVEQTTQDQALGTALQGKNEQELISLDSLTGQVQAEFTLNREAAFNNFVGFYRVADVNGGIDTNGDGTVDLRPGDSGYAQAAVQGRVSGVDLTVTNQGTANFTAQLAGGSLFAPFINVDGRPEQILEGNSNNAPAVYFSFLGANADGVDHIRLLGDNTFGFEDKFGGGDFDYNDLVVNVKLTPNIS